MGNQAQQSQELELWQVVSSPAHTRGRQTRPGRSNAHTRSDIQRRGNVSDYRNTRTVRTARTGNTGSVRIVQTRNTGSAGTVRMRNAGSAEARRTRNAGSAGVRRMRNAGSAGMIRTPGSGNRTRAQASKKQKPGRRARISQFLAFGWIVAMSVAILFMGKIFYQSMQKSPVVKAEQSEKTSILENLPIVGNSEKKPAIREDFLTVSEYNLPLSGISLYITQQIQGRRRHRTGAILRIWDRLMSGQRARTLSLAMRVRSYSAFRWTRRRMP